MPNGAQNLGAQLGQLILGGGSGDKSFYEGQALGAQTADRMASARKSRAEALIGEDRLGARQGINPEALTTAGYAPNQAALLGSILRSNDVVDLSRLGDLQAPTAGGALADAAKAVGLGDMTTANNNLALASGKPLETTAITDGTVYNKYAPTDQHMSTTALGDASIDLRHAQAGASNASAASSYASAARSRAGIGADRAANYELLSGNDGVVRVNKLTGDVQPLTVGGKPVVKASAGGASAGQVIQNPDGSTTFIPGGKPNTQELTNAGFYSRMVEANKTLDGLEGEHYDPTNTRDVASKHIPLGNVLTSETGQKYQQAAMNWIRANLRKESGAAIGKDEAAQEYANYFPQYGDGPEVIAQKASNRRNVESAMRIASGPAASLVMGNGGGAPAAAPAQSAPAQGGYQIGQIIMHGSKQYRVTGGDPNDPDVEPVQ